MPLEDRVGLDQWSQQFVIRRGRSRVQWIPADFRLLARSDPAAEDMRQQLATQADAQHRQLFMQRLFDQAAFRDQVRVATSLSNLHRSTQNDQCLIAFQTRLGIGVAGKVYIANAMTTLAQHGVEDTQGFGSDMLQYQNAGHGLQGDRSGRD